MLKKLRCFKNLKTKITYHRATTDDELYQILELQKQNLSNVLSPKAKQQEGFVTLQHDFDTLKKMNHACAHCIAKNDDKVIGYALSMLQDFKDDISLLVPMFNEINKALSNQLLDINYIAMGQICIDKNHRGKGVFRGLYSFMKQELQHDFDAIITEVDTKNTRSSNAHKAVGFELLKYYTFNNQMWEIIILKL